MQPDAPTSKPLGPMAPPRFPGEDAGRSLVEMAQRDLDAALQLLADRAQYITGATGAAIALRRSGTPDMLCRASTGENAPELGALLSTEFGLSGESVRTKRALRCDDAERDARVNRDVCRRLGIASVVVMPVVHDDEVLGVFELFSGRANAFGERDLSAIQRLSQMVETAVQLAHVAQTLPERLECAQASVSDASDKESEDILDVEISEQTVATPKATAEAAAPMPVAAKETGEVVEPKKPTIAEPVVAVAPSAPAVVEPTSLPKIDSAPVAPAVAAAPIPISKTEPAVAVAPPAIAPVIAAPEAKELDPVDPEPAPLAVGASVSASAQEKKPLFWSAANAGADSGKAETDQSHVPPVLRGLKTCQACGFPVSAGRTLCVECEEKKWKGQLKR